jgi:transposase
MPAAMAKNNRLFPEAVFWRVRTGLPWRDLPPAFSNWSSQVRQFRGWVRSGVFKGLYHGQER